MSRSLFAIVLICLAAGCSKSRFNTEYIIMHSQERKPYYNLDSIDVKTLQQVDSAFYTAWMYNTMAVMEYEFDANSPYYLLDHAETDSSFMFSLLQQEETGYLVLYHIVYDKFQEQVTQIDLAAATGADGGHSNKDKLHYNKGGNILTLESVSTLEDDSGTVQYDSVFRQFNFRTKPSRITLLDSFHRTYRIE